LIDHHSRLYKKRLTHREAFLLMCCVTTDLSDCFEKPNKKKETGFDCNGECAA
jgi:hypothetical protein